MASLKLGSKVGILEQLASLVIALLMNQDAKWIGRILNVMRDPQPVLIHRGRHGACGGAENKKKTMCVLAIMDDDIKRRKLRDSKKRSKIMKDVWEALNIDTDKTSEEAAADALAWAFSTNKNSSWKLRVFERAIHKVQGGQMIQKITKDVVTQYVASSNSDSGVKKLMATAELTWDQYEILRDQLGTQWDSKSQKWTNMHINGVEVPRLLPSRSTAWRVCSKHASDIAVNFVRLPEDHVHYDADVVGYEVPIDDVLRRWFLRKFTSDSFWALPSELRRPLVLSLNMDGYSVEDNLSLTAISIAVTNLGPVSKSVLLREPLGIAACADSEREYWSVLFEHNIARINDMIQTGTVSISINDTLAKVPVKVRF